jgi:penicillin-binding protein 1A
MLIRRCVKILFLFFLLIPLLLFYLYILKDLPDIKSLRAGGPAPGSLVYAADGVVIGEFRVERGKYIPLNRISPYLVNAVVATEDARFFRHRGIDYIGLGRAIIKDLFSLSFREGGSTITQQLAKVLYLSHEKTFRRKLREAVIAIMLERQLTKEEILELYLNRAYFGSGAYGVEMASETYFGKSAGKLSLKEAAMIAGLLKAPNRYSPFRDLERAGGRARVVLRRMEASGYLKPSERKMAENEPLILRPGRQRAEPYGYFLSYIRNYLEDKYGPERLYGGGLRVYTTIRRWAQLKAAETLRAALRVYDRQKGWRGPAGHKTGIMVQNELRRLLPGSALSSFRGKVLKGLVLRVKKKEAVVSLNGAYSVLRSRDARWARYRYDEKSGKRRLTRDFNLKRILRPGDLVYVRVREIKNGIAYVGLEQIPLVQGAIVALEPSTGEVQAMVGGYDYRLSPFNRAVRARRQAGSAFKPFIYALALEKGYTAVSILKDEPVEYPMGDGRLWRPVNYDHRFRGDVTLRDALVHSLNVPTVRLARAVGLGDIASFARSVGITSKLPEDLSLSLGSLGVTPLELAASYTVFANQGKYHTPLFIRRVTRSDGKILEENFSVPRGRLDPGAVFVMTDIMRDVIRRGTGKAAGGLPFDTAGKTGTTDNYRDAWFVGYSPELLAAVWIGYDDGRSLGPGMSGGRLAAPVWKDFMRKVSGTAKRRFTAPPGVTRVLVSRKTGRRVLFPSGDSYREYFLRGTEPGWGGIR